MAVISPSPGIKSIQRGRTQITSASVSVTVTSVDTTKSMLIVDWYNGRFYLDASGTGATSAQTLESAGVITSSTQIILHRPPSFGPAANPYAIWQLVEFE